MRSEIIGMVLLAIAGTKLNIELGFTSFNGIYLAVFAVGIITISTAPLKSLRKRVESLEASLLEIKKAVEQKNK